MEQIKNKKGLSNVIVAVLLILIAVVAVSLIWIILNDVLHIINKVSLSPSSFKNCLDMQTENTIKIEKACYNVQTEDIEITLLRQSSQAIIDNLNFLIGVDSGDVIKYTCSSNCNNCEILSEAQNKIYYISPGKEQMPKTVKIAVGDCGLGEENLINC